MKTARHPFEYRKTTLGAYAAEFGGKLDRRWLGKERPRARCPACETGFSVVGEDTINFSYHFSYASRRCNSGK